MKSPYPLEDICRVRRFRVDRAEREVTQKRRLLQQAQALCEARKREVREYHDWRLAEERREYEKVMGQQITMADLNRMRARIADLRTQEMSLEDLVTQAENGIAEAQKVLDDALREHIEKSRALEKLLVHRESWMKEWQAEQEQIQDKEMEEFARGRRESENGESTGAEDNEMEPYL
jgi:flagellar biosynthesis chaperone FliJ